MSKHTVHSPNKSGRETPPLTALSLFAGVGGFDLGFERAGIRVIAQCEIDPHAASVLRRHWPDVPVVSDVTTLNGAEYVADIITGGFPCQDLSVAGKRAGLDGERSGLFFEIVRIVHEMREATDGQYPRWVVLENVVGAFSSNGGADFAAVLESLVGGEVGRPADGWTNAGVAFGPLGSLEWRVLDSQHFGVAQRRRRVFLVYHPGSERAGQVLLEPQGVRGDTPSRVEAREGATRGVEGGAGGSSAGNPDDNRAQAGFLVPVENDTAPTVLASWGHNGYSSPRGDGTDPIVPVPSPDLERPVAFKVRGGKEGGGKGYLGSEDQALTLDTTQSQYLAEPVAFVASDYSTGAYEPADKAEALTTSADRTRAAPIAFALRGREDGATPEVSGDRTNALRSAGGGSSRDYVAYGVVSKGNGEAFLTPERHMSLTSGGGQAGQGYPAVMAPVAFAENSRAEVRLEGGDGQVTGALSTGGGKPGQGHPTVATPYAVRRLTPKECCRLQGFPDEWTRYAADGTEIADTHRYRMMGNAVTVSVAEWIARRLKEALS